MRRKILLQAIISNATLGIHFTLTIVLSRLLSPEDVGIFSMSAVLMAVAHVFRDFGVTAYIKQIKNLDDDTIRATRTMLICTSTTVAAFMYLSGPLWASFFKEPRVSEVIAVLALGFLFIPFGAVASSILNRQAEVGKFAIATTISTTIYAATSITLAANSFGYMAMAWANLVNILCHGLILNILLGKRLPWQPKFTGWGRIAKFGAGNLTTNLLIAISAALPDIALGRLANANAVGLFSRANGIVTIVEKLLQRPINYFTLPQMAKLHHTTGAVGKTYLSVSSIIQCLMLPSLFWISASASQLITLLYGEKWLEAASAVPFLCASIAISTSFALAAPTLTSVGRSYAPIIPIAFGLMVKVASILYVFEGTLASFALGILLGEALSIPVQVWTLNRGIGQRWQDWLKINTWQLSIIIPINLVLFYIYQFIESKTSTVSYLLLSATLSAVIHIGIYSKTNLPIGKELRNAYNKLITK